MQNSPRKNHSLSLSKISPAKVPLTNSKDRILLSKRSIKEFLIRKPPNLENLVYKKNSLSRKSKPIKLCPIESSLLQIIKRFKNYSKPSLDQLKALIELKDSL